MVVLMAGYQPLHITGNTEGLIQSRVEFILPNDAYPVLENAFIWRERIKRKQGYQLLARLTRRFTDLAAGTTVGATLVYNFNLKTLIGFSGEPDAQIEPGSVLITVGPPDNATFQDDGNGGFIVTGVGVSAGSSINYLTGDVTIVLSASTGGASITANVNYFPNLPVMGLRTRELSATNNEQLIAFDQKYAYRITSVCQEFIPGTTWTGSDSDFFWTTNYWNSPAPNNTKIFWATNFSGTSGDPIRYTDGNAWIDFFPIINAAGDRLQQCRVLLPFRSRLVAFNTLEGATLAASAPYTNRIRWAAIGNPITEVSSIFPLAANIVPDAWRDDIRGKGGFLDIPTTEAIIAVGFVRDNLVIYCERSTWQLRYTGQSIAPFQIEKVNTELGAESTFSAVQFDTSLVGIGDKGVVQCDSFKSERIDIKIPDLVYQFNNENFGVERVHGIRDFGQRLAFWTYPYRPNGAKFPDRRLVYNYENKSWAIFTDSLTTLGNHQPVNSRRWIDYPNTDPNNTWENQNYPWINRPSLYPAIVGGNQQGFVEYLDSQVSNDVSLFIKNITGQTPLPTIIESPNHNLQTGQVITISNIPTTSPFAATLNGNNFGIVRVDEDNFELWIYDPNSDSFDIIPQTDASGAYTGGGRISVRDGFRVVSKKFNYVDDGQSIQLGYIDVLLNATSDGAITLKVYMDYNDEEPVNTIPNNTDNFFNTTIPTTQAPNSNNIGNKYWQRVFCPTRGNFITVEYTLSNGQLVSNEQSSDVEIDGQVLWTRPAGRLTQV